jgi:hypothetical protein
MRLGDAIEVADSSVHSDFFWPAVVVHSQGDFQKNRMLAISLDGILVIHTAMPITNPKP